MQRERGLERIADDIVEIESRQPPGVGEAVGVDHDERAERLGLLPERRERRIGQLAAADVGQNFRALEAELCHAALELVRRLVAVLQRHAAEREETVGRAREKFGDAVVEDLHGFHRDLHRHGEIQLRGRGHHELEIDAHLVEIAQAVEKCASGTLAGSRWGFTSAAAAGTPTWEWMSIVVLFGRSSCPGLPCSRAAVGPYGWIAFNWTLLL